MMTDVSHEKDRGAGQAPLIDQRRQLCEELRELAHFYVATNGGHRRGMEAMCDHFFQEVANSIYPGAWAGLLRYAMRQAG